MPGFELMGDEERDAIVDLFDKNGGILFAHGFDGLRKGIFKVREFERAVADKLGAKYCQAVSSGSTALLVALRALGVKPGDEVITTCFTFVATVEAIIESGATPIIAEVDNSLNIDPEDIKKRITKKTKGIIPVHMSGAAADLDAVMSIAKKNNLWVMEDAAQGIGAKWSGKSLGTVADIAIYSLDFAKNITTGEGGLIVTDNKELYEKARAYHDHGHEYNPDFPRGLDTRSQPGFNFRMTEIQGAIGLVQLGKLDRILEAQRANKKKIKDGLADLGLDYRVIHQPDGDIGDHIIFFCEDEAKAATVAKALQDGGVGTKNLPDALTWHYSGTWQHLFHDYPHLANCDKLWPVSDKLLRRAIAIPVWVKMTDEAIEKAISIVKAQF